MINLLEKHVIIYKNKSMMISIEKIIWQSNKDLIIAKINQ